MPVVLQLTQVECGAACLTMILKYFGRKTTLSECRERLGIGRDGSTALGIARVARTYGLRVKSYSCEPNDFQYVSLPAIIHWNFSHFVVLEAYTADEFLIVDPSGGRRRVDRVTFDQSFTGVIVTFEPAAEFVPAPTTKTHPWLNYLRYALHAPGLFVVLMQVLVASLALQVFGLAMPVLTMVIVDEVLVFRLENLLAMLGLGMLVLVGIQALMSLFRALLLIYLRAKMDTHLMLGFFEHLLSLPFRFFQIRSTGDLMMRLSSNATIREVFTSQTISTLLDGMLVVVYLFILMLAAPVFGILALAIGALQIIVLVVTARYIHRLTEQELATQAESQGYLVEALNGISILKASGAEARAYDRWTSLFFKNLNVSLRRSHADALINAALSVLSSISPFLLLWVGAYYVLQGSMSLGTMLALTAIARAFLGPLSSLAANGQRLQFVGAHLERIADVMEAAPEQRPGASKLLPTVAGEIRLKGVSFRYETSAPRVLHDISLDVRPGQKIALVGSTGSGKSTLAMLLLGLYQPEEGEILFDGRPLSELNLQALRRHFGIVLQESPLFSGSIRQNIVLNDPEMPLSSVIEAARRAAIDEEIGQMPMAYETLISEGGIGLSGGQRQRIALARAIAHDPRVLVLDEATSHLDVITEALIDEHLNQLAITRIVIAHRLSTIQNADLILVLDQGRIVERGTHDELAALGGRYTALVRDQLSRRDGAVEAGLCLNGQPYAYRGLNAANY